MKNREIKFRFWNGKDMISDVHADLSINEFFEESSKYYKSVMQFTGLYDKNGVEIYEGDIFEVAGNRKYEVKYLNVGISNFEWYGGAFILWFNDDTFFPFDEYAIANGKVIGNVFNNPELLK